MSSIGEGRLLQPVLFDLEAGQAAKAEVLEAFESKGAEWLFKARTAAREILRSRPTVTSDDVLEKVGLPYDVHHNVIGALFLPRDFVRVDYTQTRRPEGHARVIGVWGRRDEAI